MINGQKVLENFSPFSFLTMKLKEIRQKKEMILELFSNLANFGLFFVQKAQNLRFREWFFAILILYIRGIFEYFS